MAVLGSEEAELAAFLALVDAKISDGSIASVHIKTQPAEHAKIPHLVQHRERQLFVRAATPAAGSDFLRVLAAAWPQLRAQTKTLPPSQRVETPTINVTMSIKVDDNYRAIAKLAFNVLAHKRGGAFVRSAQFDPIREYIRGNSIVHKDPLPPGDLAVDTRFVRPMSHSEPALIATGSHAVVLGYSYPTLFAFVTLYSHYSFFVRLGDIELSEFTVEAHEFSTDRSSNRALTLEEIVKRLAATANKPAGEH
jgi:hypothetical protein